MSKSPERLAPGTLVREYKIKRLLGEGGMGEVYLAQHTYTQQEVAVKAVSPLLMRDEAVRRRFLEEGRVLAMLKHPNIVLLYTFFEEAAQFFLVMEYVEGQSIEQWLASHSGGQPVPTDRVLAIMEHVLEGLAYAHRQQPPVVHRDVKPANVLLDRAGRAVVTDFGIAKAMGREKLTRTGGVVGTFEYMSPEQVRGEDVTPATDVYSAGIMLYRMLTGVVPFPQTSTTGFECMDAHIRQLPPSLQVTRPDLPASLAEVVRKSLEKEPALRYRNAGEMLCALRSVDFSCPADRPPDSPPKRANPRPGTRTYLLAGALVIGALVIGGLLLRGPDQTPAPASQPGPPSSSAPTAAQTHREPPAPAPAAPAEQPAPAPAPAPIPPPTEQSVPTPATAERPAPSPAPAPAEVPAPAPAPEPAPAEEPVSHSASPLPHGPHGMQLVWIPAGSFKMGSTSAEKGRRTNETLHSVTLTQGFWLGRTEVTQAQWRAVMGTSPSTFSSCGDDCPVETVSWLDAVEFCNLASDQQGLHRCYAVDRGEVRPVTPCDGYRLPTEAEWEYAARAGSSAATYGDLALTAWGSANAGGRTHPVGLRTANDWGLYDMLGNVCEWVWDLQAPYPTGAVQDPTGPEWLTGAGRGVRGGSFVDVPRWLRAAVRGNLGPSRTDKTLGFRVAREAGQ